MIGDRSQSLKRTDIPMVDKKTVYIETSVVSYLTARPSNELLVAAWQNHLRLVGCSKKQVRSVYIRDYD